MASAGASAGAEELEEDSLEVLGALEEELLLPHAAKDAIIKTARRRDQNFFMTFLLKIVVAEAYVAAVHLILRNFPQNSGAFLSYRFSLFPSTPTKNAFRSLVFCF